MITELTLLEILILSILLAYAITTRIDSEVELFVLKNGSIADSI
jgi:hypothetical protein